MHDLLKKIIHTAGTRVSLNVLGLLSLSVTAKFLGPEGRGIFVSVASALTLIIVFGSFALGNATINFAAEIRNGSWLNRVLPVLAGHIIMITFAVVIALVIVTFDGVRPLQSLSAVDYWIAITILPLQFIVFYSQPLGSSLDIIQKLNNINIFAQILSFVLIVVGVAVVGFGPTWLLTTLMIRQGISAIGFVRLTGSKMRAEGLSLRGLHYSFSDAKILYAKGLRLYPGLLGAALFSNADVIMLNYYAGVQSAGIYQAGIQFVQQVMLGIVVMNIILRGQMARVNPLAAWQEQRKVIGLIFLLTFLGGVLLAVTADWWMLFILGESFEGSIKVFRWGLLSLIGLGLSSAMSAQFIGRGRLLLPGIVNLFAGVMNVFANMWLIPKHGPLGAIWATIGSSLIVAAPAIWMFFVCERELNTLN